MLDSHIYCQKKKTSASIQKKKKSKEVQRKVLACSRTTHLENLHLKNMFTSASLCKAAQTIISRDITVTHCDHNKLRFELLPKLHFWDSH